MNCVAAKTKWRKNKIILKPYLYRGVFLFVFGNLQNLHQT